MSKKKVAADMQAEEAAQPQPAIQLHDRDVVIGAGSAFHKTNLLLMDVIHLHRVIHVLSATSTSTNEGEQAGPKKGGNKPNVAQLVDRFVNLIQKGKAFELAGWKDVPSPFMKSTGRFLSKVTMGTKDAPDEDNNEDTEPVWKELSDTEAKDALTKIVKAEIETDMPRLTESPYKEFKAILSRKSQGDEPISMPEAKDVILLHTQGPETDKIFDQQSSNRAIFSLASQYVTSFTNSPEKRVEAALAILQGIDEAEIIVEEAAKDKPAPTPTSKVARFLVRASKEDASLVWSVLDTVDAIEFVSIFVFEVYLEKEIHVPSTAGPTFGADGVDTSKEGTVPVPDPTDHDVLFGRGGMTNSHVGNRRFRDVIALHRPDYCRAIKMDKPGK